MKPVVRQLTLGFALATAGVLSLLVAAGSAVAHDAAEHHAKVQETMRSVISYKVPDVKLVRDDGKTVSLPEELNDGRPVVLNFIYTTCSGICPVLSQTFSQLQEKLGGDREKIHLMSISIDPEQDTPARLREYARKFGAAAGWQHYTGTVAASLAVQRAFDVYRGDKMSHTAVTLLRMAPEKPWVRIDGFATGDDLLNEFHDLVASN